jgi:SAM-dependent methyltransferase
MHDTSLIYAKSFYETYVKTSNRVVDIGGRNVNGSFKDIFPNYIALDFIEGPGVDIVMEDPYTIPLPDESEQYIISSSCFEHCDMFWLLFLEIMRVLKPNGVFYLNVPSNGDFHRWPVDCWRFYPDSGNALVSWAKRNKYKAELLESFVGKQKQDIWNDYVAVFIKNADYTNEYPNRMIDKDNHFNNGYVLGKSGIINYEPIPQDRL